MNRHWLWSLALCLAACGGGGGGTPDAGDGREDGGDSPAAVGCIPTLEHKVEWRDPDSSSGAAGSADFVWTGSRVAGVWGLGDAGGYRVMEVDPSGATPARAGTLWPDVSASDRARLAVSNGVIAIVENTIDPESHKNVCRLGLARLATFESIRPPTQFSDATEQESNLHLAELCDVATLGDGFVLVWQQESSRMERDVATLAQRIAADGSARGDRLTLGEHASGASLTAPVASDGSRVAVAAPDSKLALIDENTFHSESFESKTDDVPDDNVQLTAAHAGYIARSRGKLWLLDAKGRATSDALAFQGMSGGAFASAFDAGYITLARDGYLVANSFDAQLGAKSKPLGLSRDRGAFALALLGDSSGDRVFVPFRDEQGYQLATLRCGTKQPPPLGGNTCPKRMPLPALDDACSDAVCHVVLRFDYLTLQLHGWSTAGGPEREVSSDEALDIASQAITTNVQHTRPGIEIDGPHAGLYFAYARPADFGAFALVGAQSGKLALGGGVYWSGRGSYWSPSRWNDSADIACGSRAAKPAEVFIGMNECSNPRGGDQAPAKIEDALDTALRSNLAASVAARGPFNAYAFLYTPTVGSCDPVVAEYVVVLSQTRD